MGDPCSSEICGCPRFFVGLVEWTGRQARTGKRGAIPKQAASALTHLDADPQRWAVRVKSVGSGFWRVVGGVADLLEAAEKLQQRWIKGIGVARALEQA